MSITRSLTRPVVRKLTRSLSAAGVGGGGGGSGILDGLSVQPVIVFSNSHLRDQDIANSQPLFRVRDSSLVTRDVTTPDEATAGGFVPAFVTHMYDIASGGWIAITPASPYATGNGRITPTPSSLTDVDMPDHARASFNGAPGCCFIHAYSNGISSTSSTRLIHVSTAGSVSNSRSTLAINGGRLEAQHRVPDAGSNTVVSVGHRTGRSEVVAMNCHLANDKLTMARYGSLVTQNRVPQFAASNYDSSDPLAAFVNFPNGQSFEFAIVFAAPLPDAEFEMVLGKIRAQYPHLLFVNDALQTWHTSPRALTLESEGIVQFGTTNRAGFNLLFEVDESEGAMLASRPMEIIPFFRPNDDHISTSLHLCRISGNLITAAVGHNLNAWDDNFSRVLFQVHEGNRISSPYTSVAVNTSAGDINYGQFIQGEQNILFFTNDDVTRTWFALLSEDEGADGFVETRSIVEQSTPPGGGQNQIYCKFAQPSIDLVRMFVVGHPTNLENPISIAHIRPSDGMVINDGVEVASIYSSGAPILDTVELPAIFTPPEGKSCRMLGASADGSVVCISVFDVFVDPTPVTNVRHALLIYDGVGNPNNAASWAYKDVGEAQSTWVSYTSDMQPAAEAHAGIRVYRTWLDGSTYKLDRLDSSDGGENFNATTIYSSASLMIRLMTTGSAEMPVILFEGGSYSSPASWISKALLIGPGGLIR